MIQFFFFQIHYTVSVIYLLHSINIKYNVKKCWPRYLDKLNKRQAEE